jgi:hypothetical protein
LKLLNVSLQSPNYDFNLSPMCDEFPCLFAGDSLNSTGYVQWGPNEPNSGDTANCGAVRRTGDLYDSYCRNLFPFFCEQSLF